MSKRWWLLTARWWQLAAERALKTAAQVILTGTGWNAGGQMMDYQQLDWKTIGIFAGVTMLMSLCFSIVSTPMGRDHDTPSVV